MKEHLLYEDNILKIIFNESKSKAESNKNFYTLYIPKNRTFVPGFYPIREDVFEKLVKSNGSLEYELNNVNSRLVSSIKQNMKMSDFEKIVKKAYETKINSIN